jgi:hypothetical protein
MRGWSRYETGGNMTLDDLRGLYNEGYKIMMRERAMRAKVFPAGHPQHEAKLREIDRAIEILGLLKDALKPNCPDIQQGELLPRKVEYQ